MLLPFTPPQTGTEIEHLAQVIQLPLPNAAGIGWLLLCFAGF